MRVQVASLSNKQRLPVAMAGIVTAILAILVLITGTASAHYWGSSTSTLVVDDDGKATAQNCNSNTSAYSTISDAVNAAAAGSIIKVCPGTYAENVVINKELTIQGAKAGTNTDWRNFGDSSESTINGLVTISATDVVLDGFSITNPSQWLGILVKTAGDNTEIKNNIIDTVGGATQANNAVGVYLEYGPDGVKVDGNKINNVRSLPSAQGILIGDSTSTDPSKDIVVENNDITNVASTNNKGAYGIQANNGASSAPTATGYTDLDILGNTISNLTGGWVHAIGLEGDTPYVTVKRNFVSNLNAAGADKIAVFFEDNPSFSTAKVHANSFAVGSTAAGIVVHPALIAANPNVSVNGQCNWWGVSDGPSGVGTGSGSLVGPNVFFDPWLKNSNLNGSKCGDKGEEYIIGDDYKHNKHMSHGWWNWWNHGWGFNH